MRAALNRVAIAWLCGVLLGALGCSARYQDNDLELVSRYRAKAMCTCIFVQERDEEFCARYSSEDPQVASYTIDWQRRRVLTQALFLWSGEARFVSERLGCVLE